MRPRRARVERRFIEYQYWLSSTDEARLQRNSPSEYPSISRSFRLRKRRPRR